MSVWTLRPGGDEVSVGDLLIVLGYGTPLMIWRGYVLSVLWGWFAVPLGAPAVSIPIAIGCAILIGLFTPSGKGKAAPIDHGKVMFTGFLDPAFALGFGYIVLQFVN